MKTLYLHIGLPKTGTTAIQNFCLENAMLLYQKANLYYPHTFASRTHFPHHQFSAPLRKKFGLPVDPRVECSFEKELNALLKECSTLPETCDILLSSESFSTFTFSDEAMTALKDGLIRICENIRIVVYLRRQDHAFCAAHAEFIKRRSIHSFELSEQTLALQPEILEGYDVFCDRWATFYGVDNLIVRPYEREIFPKGNVVADFLRTLSRDESLLDKVPVSKRTSNPTMPFPVLMFKVAVNNLYHFPNYSQNFIPESIFKDFQGESYDSVIFPSKKREVFLARFEAGNRAVAQRFHIGNGELFLEKKIPENLSMAFSSELTDARMADIFQAIGKVAPYKALFILALIESGLHSDLQIRKETAEKFKILLEHFPARKLMCLFRRMPYKFFGVFKLPGLSAILRILLAKGKI